MRRPSTFTAHPEIYSHWVQVSQAILRGPSPLTPAQRELIGAYVSSLNACQYCYGGHRAAAELFGVSPQAIDGLIQDLGTAPIEAKLLPLFAFVKKLTLTPTRRKPMPMPFLRRVGTRLPCIPPSRFAACSIS
jgi:AhpD family alkylhydroperoxidase